MNNNPIDKLFRDKLFDHEEAYPSHLWDNVYKGINGEPINRKRNGGLWLRWMATAVLLLLAVSLGFYAYQNFWGSPENEQQMLSQSTEISDDIDVQHQDQGLGVINYGDEEETSSAANEEHENNDIDSQDGENAANIEGSSSYGDNSNIKNNFYSADENQIYTTSSETKVKSNVNATPTRDLNTENGSGSVLGKSTTNTGTENNTLLRKSRKNEKPVENIERAHAIEDGVNANNDQMRLIRDEVGDLSGFGKKRFLGRWTMSFVYGPEVAFRNFDTRDPGSEALLNQRKGSERFVNAFTTGIELNLEVRHWRLYSGVHYGQINERVEYIEENSERTVDGNPVKGEWQRSIVNRYRMVSIPLMVGYELTHGPWEVEIQAGADIGVFMSTSGQVFDPEALDYVAYSDNDDTNPYRSNPGLGWRAGAMLSYKTGYGQSLFVRPTYRILQNSFTKEEYGLEQKYSSLGIMAGYRINL
ncbi:MAG: hypothetical protein R3275_06080 [Saprospiraceae bacterium]|nr:hypothetical protein [Saprospiraceae bacterium]